MKEFRSVGDLDMLTLPGNVSGVILESLTTLMDAYAQHGETYCPEEDGWTVLIEPGDTDEDLRAALGGHTLLDAPFESCWQKDGCLLGVILFNNQFGITVVVPDEPWLPPEVQRRMLEHH